MKKRYKPLKFVSFLEMTDDPNELLELLGQAESLEVQAASELKLRKTERAVIRERLRKVRRNLQELEVSDHAIVRYLERVTGLDIEACKKEILSKLPHEPVPINAEVFVTISGGMRYVIRDKLIISVTPGGATPKPEPHIHEYEPKEDTENTYVCTTCGHEYTGYLPE